MTAIDTIFKHQDFGVLCNGSDEGVVAIWGHFRQGGHLDYASVNAGDIIALQYRSSCGYHPSGTVTTTLSGPVQYFSPAPGSLSPSIVSGNTLTYNISDFDSIPQWAFDVIVKTDTYAILGTPVCITVSVTSSLTDINPANNTLTECFPVLHSWDPNEKEVYPTTVAQPGDWQTYTINFQNTGTDTAANIIIRDTLSNWLDARSFQYLGSSAQNVVVNLIGNAVEFGFPRIDLVDSGTNELLSRGWVQYKIKTKTTLPAYTPILNTAYIYFDFNPAVVTNTVSSSFSPLGIIQSGVDALINLYPNPNNGLFTLESYNIKGKEYSIYNNIGQLIDHKTITADKQKINMADQASGIYTLICDGKAIRFGIVK